jgi:hypothetical protein
LHDPATSPLFEEPEAGRSLQRLARIRNMAQKVWTPPSWVEELPFDPPDSISVCDFITSEKHGRRAHSESKAPYTCGLTGKEYSSAQVKERVENLANGLAKELGWEPNKGSEWDKVIGIFAVNTVSSSPSIKIAEHD